MKESFGGGRFGRNERAKDEQAMRDDLSLHNEGLYDEGEDVGGEKYNLATGHRFVEDSKHDPGAQELDVVETNTGRRKRGYKDALPPLPEEDDDAAKFLREHAEELKRMERNKNN